MYRPYFVNIAMFNSKLKNDGLSGVSWDESIKLNGIK